MIAARPPPRGPDIVPFGRRLPARARAQDELRFRHACTSIPHASSFDHWHDAPAPRSPGSSPSSSPRAQVLRPSAHPTTGCVCDRSSWWPEARDQCTSPTGSAMPIGVGHGPPPLELIHSASWLKEQSTYDTWQTLIVAPGFLFWYCTLIYLKVFFLLLLVSL